MPGGGEDDVVARQFARVERLAVERCVGEQAGDVLGRQIALGLRQCLEIGLEILHGSDDDLEQLLGREVGDARLVKVFVLPAEHLLGQKQHPGFVRFGHAENLHDDVERIGCGDFLDEIDDVAGRDQPINGPQRQFADVGFDPRQVLGHEPVLRQAAQLGVDRRIERNQRANQIGAAAGDRAGQRLARLAGQHRWARRVQEARVVLGDAHHVVIAGDQPERFEAVVGGFDPQHGRFGTDRIEQVEQRGPGGIRLGIDHRTGDFGRGDGSRTLRIGERGHQTASALAAAQ